MKSFLFIGFAIAAFLALPNATQAQKVFTRSGQVSFDATANNSPEEIKAVNKAGTCVLDTQTGALEMAVLIKGFVFERALMQEHFNENYLESTQYPKATFKGRLDQVPALRTDGTYKTNASGTFTMHGVSKQITAPVTFTVSGGKISATSSFSLPLADYNIDIPSVVADKISKTAKVTVTAALTPLN